MNSKKALGLITLAGACASFSAFANTTNKWFVADASANPALVNVTTNGTAVVEPDRFVIDNDPTSPFSFTPTVALTSTNSTNIARIDVKARLTACRTNDFAVSVSGAKVGFAVGIDENNATNYYGYLNNAWMNLGGVPNLEADTAFSIIMNFRDGQARFIANGVDLTQSFTPGGTLNHLEAYGEGSIASITSSYEVAVAAYAADESEAKKYGSIAEAKAAAIADGNTVNDVQGVSADGTTQAADATAANGMSYVVCEALGIDVTDPNANIAVAPVATDTATDKITLAVNVAGALEAGVVQYEVSNGETTTYCDNPAEIQIPLEAGTYTIKPVLK